MAAETPSRTAARLPYYLEDILFPATRIEVLRCAEENEAPDALLDVIEQLPDRSFWSVREIIARVRESAEKEAS